MQTSENGGCLYASMHWRTAVFCRATIDSAVLPMAHSDGGRPLLCVTCQVFVLWVFFAASLKHKTKKWKNYRHLKKLKIILPEDKNLRALMKIWVSFCQFCNFCGSLKRITKYVQFYVKVIRIGFLPLNSRAWPYFLQVVPRTN